MAFTICLIKIKTKDNLKQEETKVERSFLNCVKIEGTSVRKED